MPDICGDNRFEIIAEYKKRLIDGTNIQSSPEEMAVIDNILFRFWQMGWIPAADVETVRHGRWITLHGRGRSDNQCFVPKYFWCDQCKFTSESRRKYCPECGAKMDKEESN